MNSRFLFCSVIVHSRKVYTSLPLIQHQLNCKTKPHVSSEIYRMLIFVNPEIYAPKPTANFGLISDEPSHYFRFHWSSL